MRKFLGFSCLMLIAGCASGPAPVASNPTPKPIAPVSRPATAPNAAVAPAAAPTPGQPYVIRPGDSLWKMAKAAYGDGTKYERILAANPGLDAAHLKIGQKIVIPIQ